VLTRSEWAALKGRGARFANTLLREVRWILGPP